MLNVPLLLTHGPVRARSRELSFSRQRLRRIAPQSGDASRYRPCAEVAMLVVKTRNRALSARRAVAGTDDTPQKRAHELGHLLDAPDAGLMEVRVDPCQSARAARKPRSSKSSAVSRRSPRSHFSGTHKSSPAPPSLMLRSKPSSPDCYGADTCSGAICGSGGASAGSYPSRHPR